VGGDRRSARSPRRPARISGHSAAGSEDQNRERNKRKRPPARPAFHIQILIEELKGPHEIARVYEQPVETSPYERTRDRGVPERSADMPPKPLCRAEWCVSSSSRKATELHEQPPPTKGRRAWPIRRKPKALPSLVAVARVVRALCFHAEAGFSFVRTPGAFTRLRHLDSSALATDRLRGVSPARSEIALIAIWNAT
jgi:hypothetical protein